MNANRRRFLEYVGMGSGALSAGWAGWARAFSGDPTPDLIVYNARVTTMDAALPKAQAFAIKGDRFIAVGTSEEIRALAGKQTQLRDAKGMTITPGFIDTHNHLSPETVVAGLVVGDAFGATPVTIESIIEKVRAYAANIPKGQWVQGQYYDDTKIVGGRKLTRSDLDKATMDHPVRIWLRGGHASVFNSAAFALAGITKDTPNPPGGTYEKDAHGELSGRVTDNAERDLYEKYGIKPSLSPEQTHRIDLAGVEAMSKKFAEFGITSICYDDPGWTAESSLSLISQARVRGNLHTRFTVEPPLKLLDSFIAAGLQTGFGDEWLRIGGTWEYALDGGLSSRTMSMTRPYLFTDPPYKGNLTKDPKEILAFAERAHRAGFRINMHCNGEPAIGESLDAVEAVLAKWPKANARPKFTHCSLPSAAQIMRIKALDGVPSLFSTYIYYNADKFKYYGADLAEHMIPYRSMIDAGVRVSTGSDFGAGPFAPLMAIQGMVTRKGFNGETWGPSQKVSVDEAIMAGTINGAYNTFEEEIKGSITPGKLADYVVFAEDLHTIAPERIINVPIVETVVGGITRYHA